MHRTGFTLTLLLLTTALCWSQPVSYPKRLALIIGNSKYQAGMELKNPVNDARAMSETLGELGFDVLPYENLSLAEMKKAIIDFGKKLKGYDVGLFYYAGHGIQYHGHNYMIPVEAVLEEEEHVEINCLPAELLLTFMDIAKTKVNLIILDACRNNPFERRWSRTSSGSGLAMMDATRGTLIAYATAPGSTASDGDGENGLYTSAILRHIRDEKLTIEQVFKRVRTEVEERSGNRQSPWEATSLSGEDLFVARGFNKKEQRNISSGGNISAENLREAEALYQSGVQKFGTKEFNDALFDLSRSLELNPYSAETQYSMGRLHYELGLKDQALADFTRSIALKQEMVIAHVWRGTVNFALNRLQDAADDFATAAQMAPKTADYRHSQGLALFKMKSYRPAAEAFQKALAVNGDAVNSRYYLGLSHYHLQQAQEAIEAFEKVIAKQPDHANALLYKALAMAQVQPEKAMEALDAAIIRNPDQATAYCERGILHLKKGNLENAANDLNRAIELDNNLAKAIFWKGLWFYQAGEQKESLYAISASLQVDSTMAEAFAWRGYIRALPSPATDVFMRELKSKNTRKDVELYEECEDDFKRALNADSKNTEAMMLRSGFCISLGKNDQARDMINQVLTIKPDHAEALYMLGRMDYEEGEFATASKTLTRSLRITKNANTYFWRAECGMKLGFAEQAIQDYTQALALRPGFGQAFFRKNEAMVAAGKYEQALSDYETAQTAGTFDKYEIILGKVQCYLQMKNPSAALNEGFKIIMPSYLKDLKKVTAYNRSRSTNAGSIATPAEKIGLDPLIQAKTLYLISEAYRNMNKKSEALDAILGALQISKENQTYKDQLELIRKMGK